MEALKQHCELLQLNQNTTYQNVYDFLYFYCIQTINVMSDSPVLQGHLNKKSVSRPVSAFSSLLPAVLVQCSPAASAGLTNPVKVIQGTL